MVIHPNAVMINDKLKVQILKYPDSEKVYSYAQDYHSRMPFNNLIESIERLKENKKKKSQEEMICVWACTECKDQLDISHLGLDA